MTASNRTAGAQDTRMTLSELQDAFQSALLKGDGGIFAALADGARESKEALLGVYRDGYMLRLIEFAENDHELLHAYLGDEAFEAMVRAYAAANPSRTRNARYFCARLPEFLAAAAPYDGHPQLAELAALEKALNDAFDAPDAPPLETAAFAVVPAADWPELTFTPHPSASRLNFATNAAAIWRALKDESDPPEECRLDEPDRLLVWRQDVAKFRSLNAEEAMLWDEAAKGARFAALCELAAMYDDPDGAALRAARSLHQWSASDLLAAPV